VACRPCMHDVCPTSHECAENISVDTVAMMAAQILDGMASHHAFENKELQQ